MLGSNIKYDRWHYNFFHISTAILWNYTTENYAFLILDFSPKTWGDFDGLLTGCACLAIVYKKYLICVN